jgi:farnesyl diphosphate synthase
MGAGGLLMSDSVDIGNGGAGAACGFRSLRSAIASAAREVDETLEEVLPVAHGLHRRVHEAMRYAVFAGGKRLRPFLVANAAGLFGVESARARRVGAAIEAVHTYSLVHDDLPCMDDDELRRGRPTTHVAFDEATAVLAGDALLTIAFEILADAATHPSPEVRCQLLAKLARAAGNDGMIGGQMIDMAAPGQALGCEDVVLLQRMKTGALFEFCCEAGPILAQASPRDREKLRSYAHDFGVVFQITDDLLDVLSTEERTGKAVGKDQGQGKATLIGVLGLEGARKEAARRAARAAEVLETYGDKADDLRNLPLFLLDRDR